MKKIIPVKHNKIWGWELWLYSSLHGQETKFEDGQPTTESGPLLKIIYTDKQLSVQVHPDDEWARKLENQQNGKSESWYILDKTSQTASLCLGLTSYDEKIIRNAIEEGSFENMLKFVNVERGQFYDIPAGLVHGIGANIVIFEVQQTSDITYRYYDFGRLENGKPRDLHIDKALKVQKNISYELKPLIKNGLNIYENNVCKQLYGNGIYKSEFRAIFVNLVNYNTFIIDNNETIEAEAYCVIPLHNSAL